MSGTTGVLLSLLILLATVIHILHMEEERLQLEALRRLREEVQLCEEELLRTQNPRLRDWGIVKHILPGTFEYDIRQWSSGVIQITVYVKKSMVEDNRHIIGDNPAVISRWEMLHRIMKKFTEDMSPSYRVEYKVYFHVI